MKDFTTFLLSPNPSPVFYTTPSSIRKIFLWIRVGLDFTCMNTKLKFRESLAHGKIFEQQAMLLYHPQTRVLPQHFLLLL